MPHSGKFPMEANSNLDWERSVGLQIAKPKAVCIHVHTHTCALFHKINVFLRNMSSTQNERGIAEQHTYDLISGASLMTREKRKKKKKDPCSPRLMHSSWLTPSTLSHSASPPSCWASGAKEVGWRSKETPQACRQVPCRSKLLLNTCHTALYKQGLSSLSHACLIKAGANPNTIS